MALDRVKQHKLYQTSMVQFWENNLSHIERDQAISQYVRRRENLDDLTPDEKEYIALLKEHLVEEWGV